MIKTLKDKRFCVYLHLDQNGVIRYVGSGSLSRPYRYSGRSSIWNKAFQNHKPEVVIVEDKLTKEDSISLEYFMYCALFPQGNLVNKALPKTAKELDFDKLNKIFYVCESSPSGLRHKQDSILGKKKSGDVAGHRFDTATKKYWRVRVPGIGGIKAHRVVYLLSNGKIDKDLVINHIDGNGLNNKPSNLEEVTYQVNNLKTAKTDSVSETSNVSKMYCSKGLSGFSVVSPDRKFYSFTIEKQGSEEAAFNAAKTLRDYFVSKLREEEFCLDRYSILKNYLKVEQSIPGKGRPHLREGTKNSWFIQIKVEGKLHYLGTFSSQAETIAARDAFVADYNSKIEVNI